MKLTINLRLYKNLKKIRYKLLIDNKKKIKNPLEIIQNNKHVNHMIFNKNSKFMIVILQKNLKKMSINLNNNANKLQINHHKFQDHNQIIINNKLKIINKKIMWIIMINKKMTIIKFVNHHKELKVLYKLLNIHKEWIALDKFRKTNMEI